MSDTDPENDCLNTTPTIVDSVIQDDSEDEVFFGKISEKEQNGKNSKFNRRRTLTLSDSDRRRSFEVPQGGTRSGSGRLFSLLDSEVPQGGNGGGSRGLFSLLDSEVPQGRNRSGSGGLFSLLDSVGSTSSSVAEEQYVEEKRGTDDVLSFNESLEQESSSQGNKDNVSSLGLEENMEVSGKICLSKNDEMFDQRNVQNNSKIDKKPCTIDSENDIAQLVPLVHNASLSTDSQFNAIGGHQPLFSGNSNCDAIQSSIESSPADSFQSEGEGKSRVSEGSLSTFSSLPVPNENITTEYSETITEEILATQNSSTDRPQPTLEEKTSLNSNNTMSDRLSAEGGSITQDIYSAQEVIQAVPKESLSTTSHLPTSESSLVDCDKGFSEDSVTFNSMASISDKDSSPDHFEPIPRETIFTNPPLGELNNGESVECSIPAFMEGMSTDLVPPKSDEIVSTDKFQLSFEEDSTDASCSFSKKDVSIDGLKSNPDKNMCIDTIPPVSSESQSTNDSQPISRGGLSNNISFQEKCAPSVKAEESLFTEKVSSVSSESLPANDSELNDQEGLSNNVNFQPIGDKEIVCIDTCSQSIIEESLSTEEVPSVSSEYFPHPISSKSLSSNELPPAIKVYLTESDPSDISKSDVTPLSEDAQSANKESSLFSNASLPIDSLHLLTSHSANDLKLESNSATQPNNDSQESLPAGNISGMEVLDGLSCTTLDISSKVGKSFGSTLEIERNVSHSVTNQLKVSSTDLSDISRSSQSGPAATFIEPLEEPPAATNSSSLSLSEKSLLVSNCANNFLSSTSDGQTLPSPNTIALGLSPQSRERMYSLMDDSNAAFSCDDTVFSDDSCDDFAEDDNFEQSNHSEDEDTESFDGFGEGDNFQQSNHSESEATGSFDGFAEDNFQQSNHSKSEDTGSLDGFVEGDNFQQSSHFENEATDSLTQKDQDKVNVNDNVAHADNAEEATSDNKSFDQLGNGDNSKNDDISVDKAFATFDLTSSHMKDDLEGINKAENSMNDKITQSDNLKEKPSENILNEEIMDYEESKSTHLHKDGDCLMGDIFDIESDTVMHSNDDGEILDVDNTQIFDDSLFSMNDENSRRLSTIGQKICKKWKKKEKKAKQKNQSSCTIEENNDLCTTKDNSEMSPNLKAGILGDDAPQFDSTADEMALYEMFGQDYDKTVDDMTVNQKKVLREKLDSRTEEDMQLTRSNLSILMDVSLPVSRDLNASQSVSKDLDASLSVSPDIDVSVPASPDLDASLSVSPNLLNVCLDVNKSVTTVDTDNFSNELVLPKRSPNQENILIEKPCFLQPDFSTKTSTKSPTDPPSLVTSHPKRVSPSPSTTKSSPWRSASPLRKSFIPTPITSGSRPRTRQLSGSAIRTPGSSSNTKAGSARTHHVDVNPSPLLGTHLRSTHGVSPSPLATYLRDNKPPPLVHQVKAQSAVRDLESTLTEVDNETAEYACPLPEAVYVAPSLAKEHVTDATNKDYNIAGAYGQTNSLAMVTRHVGRVKTGIHWGEELVTDQSLMSSPSQCQMLPVGKSVLKKTQRDSGTFDESMVDMSVLETVAVKKIGRGKNKRTK